MTRTKKAVLAVFLTPVAVILALVLFVAYSTHYGRPVPPARPGTIKVACVGDSITYGWPSEADRYPYQLETLLGSAYSVRNFGAIGYTAQKAGDWPYWEHRYFRLSTEFQPDVVAIMLGTNDSKTQNWTGAARFSGDYRALIAHYQSLPSKPRIVLMTPPSTFLVRGKTALPGGMNGEVIAEISGIVKDIGASLSIPVVDIHAATANHPEFFQFDGVHPNGAGEQLIAQTLYDTLKTVRNVRPATAP